MSTPIPGIDSELLAVIETRARELEAMAMEVTVEGQSKTDPVAEYLAGKQEFPLKPNTATFKEVFGWTPRTIPNIPVPKYKPEYWDVAIRHRIPSINPKFTLHKPLIEEICYAMYCDGTSLLYGPTGTGKTAIPQQLAARFGMPFLGVSCHGQMEQSEFLGTNQVETDPDSGTPITKHSDTDTTMAAKFGGILVIDEAFRAPSSALMSIQSLLEYPHVLNLQDAQGVSRQYEVPLNDFKLVLTDNTNGLGDETGNYTAEIQDIATLNRVRRAVYVDYMPANAECSMVHELHPAIPENLIDKMVETANLVRKSFKAGQMQQTMSIRELISWASSLEDLRSVAKSFKYAVLNRLSETDTKQACDIYQQVFNESIRG